MGHWSKKQRFTKCCIRDLLNHSSAASELLLNDEYVLFFSLLGVSEECRASGAKFVP